MVVVVMGTLSKTSFRLYAEIRWLVQGRHESKKKTIILKEKK